MRLSNNALILLFLAASLNAFPALDSHAESLSDYPVKNLRVPVELYEDGSEKIQLTAEGARIKRKDETQLANATVQFFRPDGVVDATLYCENCVYHSNSKSVMSQSKVRMEKDGIVISGKGMECNADEETLEITSNAKVDFPRNRDDDAGISARTVITSNYLTFDYYRHLALFEGEVEVSDPQVSMSSGRLAVVFEGTNSIKSATADGNVRAVAENGDVSCQKAVFISAESKAVMTGDVVLSSDGSKMKGSKVTIWLNENRMTCEPGQLVIPEKKKDLRQINLDEEPSS